MSRYRIEPLGRRNRADFASGSEPLDRYFHETVTQDVRRRLASCFVAIADDDRVAGFYTIAAASLLLDLLPPERAKRLPRYPLVPAILLGRLAVDRRDHGHGLGGALVIDALERARRAEVLAYALIVDAKNAAAAAFYRRLGFESLTGDLRRLILPL